MTKKNLSTATEEIAAPETKNVFKAVLDERIKQVGAEELRAELNDAYNGEVWTNDELLADYEISHFDPPYVHVIRKHDGVRGTVAYTEAPRVYFSFVPLEKK